MRGLVVKSTGLWYEVSIGGKKKIARLRGKLKLENKKLTNPIAVGDCVDIVPNNQVADEWVIQAVFPRENYVIRQSPRKKGFDHIIASNIDQGILIATLRMPRTSPGFIDRFLISLEAFRIPGVIIFNKSDLYDARELALYHELKEIYTQCGYEVMLTSLKEEGVDPVKKYISSKRSLLSGHSGSGKSTLINRLIPDADQAINEVSTFANKGVHTTTFAELFEVDAESSVIDTPGIKELGLSDIAEDELSHYFPEMRAFLGNCRFNNCVHSLEPGCAIKAQVGTSISERRYESYLSILQNEDNRK